MTVIVIEVYILSLQSKCIDLDLIIPVPSFYHGVIKMNHWALPTKVKTLYNVIAVFFIEFFIDRL